MIAAYRFPRRKFGEWYLARLDEIYFQTVVYLGDSVPRGTGFFVAVSDGGVLVPYLVTARHNIEMSDSDPIFVRTNSDAGLINTPTLRAHWHVSDTDDVAVIQTSRARFPSEGRPRWTKGFVSIRTDLFINAAYKPDVPAPWPPSDGVGVGDEVHFLGLFTLAAGESENLPIARFGTIARMPTEPIRLERTPGDFFKALVYLLETRSVGGHSGSPVFWDHNFVERRPAPQELGGGLIDWPQRIPFLLGLVSGHFDEKRKAETTGDVLGEIRVKANTGIAYVTPAEAIRRLLMRDDVKAEREEFVEEAKAAEGGPTMDIAEGESEFQRFEDLARKLANTPKPEKQDEA